MQRVTNGFNARAMCLRRTYAYYLPLSVLEPVKRDGNLYPNEHGKLLDTLQDVCVFSLGVVFFCGLDYMNDACPPMFFPGRGVDMSSYVQALWRCSRRPGRHLGATFPFTTTQSVPSTIPTSTSADERCAPDTCHVLAIM